MDVSFYDNEHVSLMPIHVQRYMKLLVVHANRLSISLVIIAMPAQATLFDHRINAVKDFGLNPRNFVRFNPQGRILCIAGFGNLNGTVDLWDLKTQKKITTFQASNASYCDWSPDGRYLMTATLTPRLRVDNGYKVWHYQGTLVYWEGVDELYQVGKLLLWTH